MKCFLTGVAFCVALLVGSSAHAETTECTEITSVPITITTQGVYCLKQNLTSNLAEGNSITIETNNVTIDFNGFKLGNLAAGATTEAAGVYALNRKNITLRGGNIRGFETGVYLDQDTTDGSSGHLIEDNRLDGNTAYGMLVEGNNIVVRDNQVINTDSTVPAETSSSYANKNSGYTPLAGTGGEAVGILINGVTNGMVEGNLILGTISPYLAVGIYVDDESSNLRISNNTVAETITTGNNAFAIYIGDIDNDGIVIHDNTLIDGQAPNISYGIYNLSSQSQIGCFNNIVTNFASGHISGCTYDDGNLPSP